MKRVLIVEDNPAHMQLTAFLLERSGYAALKAGTAEEGIGIARRERPDVILMDINLPGMDGLAATRELKQDPATQAIKIIALTSHRDTYTAADARAAGADGFIEKPFHYEKFLSILHGVLPAH